MANTTKLTKAQKFAMLKAIPEVAGNPLLVEFIDHELELLTKKNSAEKKPTAQQVENQVIAQAILAHLTAQPTRLFTVTELMKEVPACAGLTNQRVSAIVRGMIGVSVERVEDKRKAFFRKLS
jgi:acetoacetate decarboxylase